jgi:hypothetical protein
VALFAISYDLIKRKDYPQLWSELEQLGAHRPMRSFWLLEIKATTAELLKHLSRYIDEDDKLMVVEFVGRPEFTKANAGTNAWIKEHC